MTETRILGRLGATRQLPHTVRRMSLAAAAVIGFATAASANVLVNGGFEISNVGGGPEILGVEGGTEPSGFGWSVTAGNIEILTTNYPNMAPAYEGSQMIDLIGVGGVGAIAQTFATTPGTLYSLTFAYGNGWYQSATATVAVTVVDGLSTLLSTSATNSGSDENVTNWAIFNETFVASGVSATLTFTNTVGGFYSGMILDAVAVEAPEPASLAVLGMGIIGMKFVRRRRPRG